MGCPARKMSANFQLRTLVRDGAQLDVEDQCGVWRDDTAAGALLTVRQRRRDDETRRAADPHAHEALIPPGNHLAGTQLKLKRSDTRRRIELAAFVVQKTGVIEPASVIDRQQLSVRGGGPGAVDEVRARERDVDRRRRALVGGRRPTSLCSLAAASPCVSRAKICPFNQFQRAAMTIGPAITASVAVCSVWCRGPNMVSQPGIVPSLARGRLHLHRGQ